MCAVTGRVLEHRRVLDCWLADFVVEGYQLGTASARSGDSPRALDVAKVSEFKAVDDYSAILLESLADWLAGPPGACTSDWRSSGGCSRGARARVLIREKYVDLARTGHPLAARTPRKQTYPDLLSVKANTGIELTEHGQWPGPGQWGHGSFPVL